jgi:hypothetical protein
MELIRAEDEVEEPLGPWMFANVLRLLIYLMVVSFFSAAFLVSDYGNVGDAFGFGFYLIVVGGIGCLPGTVVWLLIVARLSPGLPRTRGRAAAAIIAPFTIGLAWVLLLSSSGDAPWLFFALWFGVLSPAGSSLVVRLRGYSRRPAVDVAF